MLFFCNLRMDLCPSSFNEELTAHFTLLRKMLSKFVNTNSCCPVFVLSVVVLVECHKLI